MDGWKSVEITEVGEPLVSLNDFSRGFPIVLEPRYFLQGIVGASQEIFLREGAALKLAEASKKLPTGHWLIVYDGYRPFNVQSAIFESYRLALESLHPDLSREEIIKMTERYVSFPSVDPTKPSPHLTGGAIDLSVLDTNGNALDMGTVWDSFDIESQTAHFRESNVSLHSNRRILYDAMTEAGFSNYPEEWWHFDYGNQFWAHLQGQKAIYGLAFEGGE
ncbi:MAG: hypothetical protein A2965_00565 [Candidatus Levybacteria bacterium RIFCSPLOWO2_01_FULL_40_96]|nr:MAG: hypothetical protein A2965_00565 [Candidatus Levybacteria bacterium RIFCSPLOWO2_01_FULL_40_96]